MGACLIVFANCATIYAYITKEKAKLTNGVASTTSTVVSNVTPPIVATTINGNPPATDKDYVLGQGGKSAICLNSKGFPYIAVGDAGNPNAIIYYWSGSKFVNETISVAPSSQWNNPCISSDGTLIYASGIAYGGAMNMDLLAGTPGSLKFSNQKIAVGQDWDTGRSCYDSVQKVFVVWSSDGLYEEFDSNFNVLKRDQMYICCGGEKKAFSIDSDGTWYAAISGFNSNQPGKNSSDSLFRSSKMGDAVSWASHLCYRSMDSDTTYCEVKGSQNHAIMVAAYNGVCYNVWDGDKMLFPLDNLPCVGGGDNGGIRFAPQIAALPNGGWWVLWSNAGSVWGSLVDLKGNPSNPINLGSGSKISGACDANGVLWYCYNGSAGFTVRGRKP